MKFSTWSWPAARVRNLTKSIYYCAIMCNMSLLATWTSLWGLQSVFSLRFQCKHRRPLLQTMCQKNQYSEESRHFYVKITFLCVFDEYSVDRQTDWKEMSGCITLDSVYMCTWLRCHLKMIHLLEGIQTIIFLVIDIWCNEGARVKSRVKSYMSRTLAVKRE